MPRTRTFSSIGSATDVFGTNFYPLHAQNLRWITAGEHAGSIDHPGTSSRAPALARGGETPGLAAPMDLPLDRSRRLRDQLFPLAHLPLGARRILARRFAAQRQPRPRYSEIGQTGAELESIGDIIYATRPAAQAAIVMSYELRWAVQSVSSTQVLRPLFGTDELDAHEEAKAYHTALMDRNVTTDALDPREDLSRYKLVIAPRLYVVDAPTAENLRRYVEGGGVLCLTPRSGVADEYNVIFDRPSPGPLLDIAGIEVDDYTTLEAPVDLHPLVDGPWGVAEGEVWADEIHLTSAEPVVQFNSSWLAGMPAITLNHYGKGAVVYVGTLLRGKDLNAFTKWLCAIAGIEPALTTPPGVRALEREGKDYRLVFLLNFSGQTHTIPLPASFQDVFSGQQVEEIVLPAAGVAILRKEK